jgi:hypothetical protein
LVWFGLGVAGQNEGCTWQLNLTNYKFYDGKAYCKNHRQDTTTTTPATTAHERVLRGGMPRGATGD